MERGVGTTQSVVKFQHKSVTFITVVFSVNNKHNQGFSYRSE